MACACHCSCDDQLVTDLLSGTVDVLAHAGCAFFRACEWNWCESVRHIMTTTQVHNIHFFDALCKASMVGHADVVRLLLQYTIRRRMCARALHLACYQGHDQVVHVLLSDRRVDVGGGALSAAAWPGHAKVVKVLLADGRIDPAARYNRGVSGAYGSTAVMREVMNDGRADPSAGGNRALRVASANGFANMVRLLLTDARVTVTRRAIRNSHAHACTARALQPRTSRWCAVASQQGRLRLHE